MKKNVIFLNLLIKRSKIRKLKLNCKWWKATLELGCRKKFQNIINSTKNNNSRSNWMQICSSSMLGNNYLNRSQIEWVQSRECLPLNERLHPVFVLFILFLWANYINRLLLHFMCLCFDSLYWLLMHNVFEKKPLNDNQNPLK